MLNVWIPSAADIAEWCDAVKVLTHWTLPALSTVLAFLQLVAFPGVSPHPPLLSLCTLCLARFVQGNHLIVSSILVAILFLWQKEQLKGRRIYFGM